MVETHHEHDYSGRHLLDLEVDDEASKVSIGSLGSVAPLLLKLISQTPLHKMVTMYIEDQDDYLFPKMAFSKDLKKATCGFDGAIGVARDLAIPDLMCSWPG